MLAVPGQKQRPEVIDNRQQHLQPKVSLFAFFYFFSSFLLAHTNKSDIRVTFTYGLVVWWLQIKLDGVAPLIADPPLLKIHQ